MRHLVLAAAVFLDVMPGACSCGQRDVHPPPPAHEPPSPQACTEEAKVCPDGSSVGRTGPDCQFAACPGEPGSSPPGDPGASGTPSRREEPGRFATPPPGR